MQRNRGFTLAEMLIVVAIIAVLIAIASVVISNSIEKSREITDVSNIRNACSEMQAIYILDEEYDKRKFEKYTSNGTNYMKTYVNCVSTKAGWQSTNLQIEKSQVLIYGAYLYAPQEKKPAVRVRLNLDTGIFDFNPENPDTGNKRICVYNR